MNIIKQPRRCYKQYNRTSSSAKEEEKSNVIEDEKVEVVKESTIVLRSTLFTYRKSPL